MISILLIGIVVGAFGAMMGVGGGVLLIPLLTGFFGVPIKTAIGTSIICVVATSCGASAAYLQRGLTHSRLAMVLEVATTAGALAGGITATWINARYLAAFFGCILLYVTYSMYKFATAGRGMQLTGLLDTEYPDPLSGKTVSYGVRNLGAGMGLSFIAGNISGLLGVGGGIIKVPMMSLVMGVPLRAAIATSNFMIGITATTSAIIYFSHGYIDPKLAIPVALGILIGAQMGTHISSRMKSGRLRQIFQVLLLIFAVQMFVLAFRG